MIHNQRYDYQIRHLTQEQNKAVLKKISFAIEYLLPEDANLKTDLEKMGYSWKKLIENANNLEKNTVNKILNGLGSFLGELFKEEFPQFEWKLFQDKIGIDLCLYFENQGKDFIIYPISSLYKGFEERDLEYIQAYYQETKDEINKKLKEANK